MTGRRSVTGRFIVCAVIIIIITIVVVIWPIAADDNVCHFSAFAQWAMIVVWLQHVWILPLRCQASIADLRIDILLNLFTQLAHLQLAPHKPEVF